MRPFFIVSSRRKILIVSPSGARLCKILLNITSQGRFYKTLEINSTMLKNVKS